MDKDGHVLANGVKNTGLIQADGGQVTVSARTAGNVLNNAIDMGGVVEAHYVDKEGNSLTLSKTAAANSTAAVPTGTPTIVLSADNGTVAVSGKLDVSNKKGQAGSVAISGKNVKMVATTVIDMGGMEGGELELAGGNEAGDTVQVAGNINAQGSAQGHGGTVNVSGNDVNVQTTAVINASGGLGGGTVNIGGSARGFGPLANAQFTTIASGASILADATVNGNGGQVVIWSDEDTQVHGLISAKGGILGGNGGSVETSGSHLDIAGSTINLTAAKGQTGTWLLDPENVIIQDNNGVDSGATNSDGTYLGTANASIIDVQNLINALNLSNITISTDGVGTAEGDITIASPVLWSGATSLTLNASHNIFLTANSANAILNGQNINSSLVLNANQVAFLAGSGQAAISAGQVTVNADVQLGQNASMTATHADVVVNGDVAGGYNLTVSNSGQASVITGAITGTNTALTHTGSGLLTLTNSNNNYTGGTDIEAGVISLATNATLGTGVVKIKSSARLALNTNTLDNAIQLQGTGANNQGAIELLANAHASLNGALTLIGATTIAVDSNSSLTFNGSIDGPYAFSVIGQGAVAFNGALGGLATLASFSTSLEGSTILNADITTSGEQDFNNMLILSQSIVNLSAAKAVFNGTLDAQIAGAEGLVIFGDATFNSGAYVGSHQALSSLSVSGATILAAGTPSAGSNLNSVTTTSNQHYSGAATIAANTTLSSATGLIQFSSTADAAINPNPPAFLSLIGNVEFDGAVGGMAALSRLSVAGNSIVMQSVTTRGNQTYTGVGLSPTLALDGTYYSDGGAFISSNQAISLIGSTLIDNTLGGSIAGGGNITLGNINGGNSNLRLNGGTNGLVNVGSFKSSGNLTLENSQSTVFSDVVEADTVEIENTAATVAFNNTLRATNFKTSAQGYKLLLESGGSNGASDILSAVTFLNTGGVSLGSSAAATLNFEGGLTSTASVTTVGGTINTNNAGLSLGQVQLASDAVLNSNNGLISLGDVSGAGAALSINSGLGSILLANVGSAGQPLSSLSVSTQGSGLTIADHDIYASSILLSSINGNVYISDKLYAAGNKGSGGQVTILGQNISLAAPTVINASGALGGGTINIGGSEHGTGPLANAQSVTIAPGVNIYADALVQGNGGQVIVWSNHNTQFHGFISAQGAGLGNGGFVETSGGYLDINGGKYNLLAPHGKEGTLLLDPTDIYIADSQGDATAAGMTTTDNSADQNSSQIAAGGATPDSLLTTANLENALASSNVIVTTSNSLGNGAGDITVVDPVTWSATTNLTLSAFRHINVNALISNTGSSPVTVALQADNTGTGIGTVTFNNGSSVSLPSGSTVNIYYNPAVSFAADAATPPTFYSGGTTPTAYMLINSLGNASDMGDSTAADTLAGLSNNSALWTSNFALGADIDATATSGWNSGLGFLPIGLTSSNSFTGSFDGQNHTVTGLYQNDVSNNHAMGFFGYVTGAATIQNLNLSQVNMTGASNTGAIVGNFSSYGNISNVSVSGQINIADNSLQAGGIVGNFSQGNIIGAFNGATLTVGNNVSNVGGLVGMASYSTISQSYNLGDLTAGTGSNYVGGLVGTNFATTLSESYNGGAVTVGTNSGVIGGLVGNNIGTILNSYNVGSVTAPYSYLVGGLAATDDVVAVISNSYNSGKVTAPFSYAVGGLLGGDNGSSVINSFWDTQSSSQNISAAGQGYSTQQMMLENTYTGAGWDFGSTWVMINNGVNSNAYTRPMLQMEYSTTIKNAHQLQLINMNSNTLAAAYTIANDIDLSGTTNPADVWGSNSNGTGFVPIGGAAVSFTGTLNGQNHTLSNLFINTTNEPNFTSTSIYAVGLFGNVGMGGTIENLNLTNVAVTSGNGTQSGAINTGGLAGGNFGTISNVNLSGSIYSDNQTGTGQSNNAGSTGGLVGTNNGLITNSQTQGAVNVLDNNGTDYVGGLVGVNYNGTIQLSGNSSNVTLYGNSVAGGAIGGLVGVNFGGTISSSYNSGSVVNNVAVTTSGYNGSTGTSNYLEMGGFVGQNTSGGTIHDSYAIGAVIDNTLSSNNLVGGFVGSNESLSAITNAYSAGIVASNSPYTGGFAGVNTSNSTILNSFWDTDRSTQMYGIGSDQASNTLLTGGCKGGNCTNGGIADLSAEATFESGSPFISGSGFDFTPSSGIWAIQEGSSYPYLQAVTEHLPTLFTLSGSTSNLAGTLYLLINGTYIGAGPDLLSASSNYVFTLPYAPLNGAGILVFLSGGSDVANAVTIWTGNSITGLNLASQTVTVGSNISVGMSTETLGAALGNYNNSSILYSFAQSNLTFTPNVSLVTTAKTNFTINGNITTSGTQSQIYNGPVILSNDATLNADVGNIQFANSVDSFFNYSSFFNLTLETSGTQTFNGAVGANEELRSLTTGTGPVVINGGVVATAFGGQTYNGPLTIGANAVLEDVAGAPIYFGSTIDSSDSTPHILQVISQGTQTFSGSIGSINPLASLNVGYGDIYLNGGSVTTTADAGQVYQGHVYLGADTNLNANNGVITFGSQVDSYGQPYQLSLNTTGVQTFNGALGLVTPLMSLTTGNGEVDLNGDVQTNGGGQTYNGPAVLNNNATLSEGGNGAITFKNTIDSGTSASALTLNANQIEWDGSVGSNSILDSLTVNGPLNIYNNFSSGHTILTNNSQNYNGSVTIYNDSDFNSQVGGINFGNVLGQSVAVTMEAPNSSVSFNGSFQLSGGGGSLVITAPAIYLGGQMTTGGAQTYNGAVSLNAGTTISSEIMAILPLMAQSITATP